MVKVTKRGNSLGVNINPKLLEVMNIKENDYVSIGIDGNKLTIEKIEKKED